MAGDLEAAQALLAGFLAGVAGGLASTAIWLIALVGNAGWRSRLPASLHLGALGIAMVNGNLIAWTLLGLVLGAAYLRAREPAFSLAIVLACLGLLGGAAFVRGRVTWPMCGAACVAGVAFGVLLPALAGAG